MQKKFKNLTDIIYEEIKLYTFMRNLYTKKKEILVKNNIEDLATVDSAIVETYESIKKLDIERNNATSLIGENINSMTALIEVAEENCPKFVSILKDQQAKLESLSSAISVLNLTNMKLINHGMILTDKKLNIIIDSCAPKGTSYTDKGTEKTQNLEMSTIVREA